MERDNADDHRKRAASHLLNYEYPQAIVELSGAINRCADDPNLYMGLAACYRAIGNEVSAKVATNKAQVLIQQVIEKMTPRGGPTLAVFWQDELVGHIDGWVIDDVSSIDQWIRIEGAWRPRESSGTKHFETILRHKDRPSLPVYLEANPGHEWEAYIRSDRIRLHYQT